MFFLGRSSVLESPSVFLCSFVVRGSRVSCLSKFTVSSSVTGQIWVHVHSPLPLPSPFPFSPFRNNTFIRKVVVLCKERT